MKMNVYISTSTTTVNIGVAAWKADERRVTSKAILPPHIHSPPSKINLINSGKQELYFGIFFSK
jgi:hypothetical protein